jgi:hypothetical protein
MILIPEGFAELGEDDQRAAVLHEFAHVLRRDYAVNLIVELASLPVCWHPLTHLIKARLRASREVACDAMASATEASPASYASRLLSLARALGPQEVASAALMTMIGKSDLEERLMQLLAQTPPPGHTRLRLLAAGAAAGAILAPALLFQVTPAFAAIATPATVAALAPVAPIDPIDPVDAPAPIAPRAPAAVVAPVAPIAPVAPVAVTRARARLAPFERLALADDPRDAAEASPTPREPAEAPIVDEAQIRQIVRQALEQSAQARRALQSAEIQKALAQARAAGAEFSPAEKAALRSEVRQEVRAALAEAREALNAELAREAARGDDH